jgi:hypothetical protein
MNSGGGTPISAAEAGAAHKQLHDP